MGARQTYTFGRAGPSASYASIAAGLLLALLPARAAATPDAEAKEGDASAPQSSELAEDPEDLQTREEGESDAELAQELTNPVADVMSFPLQSNFDFGLGPEDDGFRYTLNIQPVVPLPLGKDWLLINRLILPIVAQNAEVLPMQGSKAGLGDTLYTAFLSSREPLFDVLIWGLGPAVSFPTTTDAALGLDRWGLGPSLVLLSLLGPVTFGALTTHVRLFEDGPDGPGDDPDSTTLLQPFVTYTWPTATGVTLQAEALYVEGPDVWNVPLTLLLSQIVPIGPLPVSFALGARWYPESPPQGPSWGLRFNVTLIVPK